MIHEGKEKTVGIIGGMGPEATVDILKRIIRLTPAKDDFDHIHCLIDNDPKVPSRIKALIEGDGENPGPYLADMAKKLESWGADFLIMPCNTAHYYYEYIAEAVSIPVVHLIDLIVEKVVDDFSDQTKVGVAASTAVLLTDLYKSKFQQHGIQVMYPEKSDQNRLLEIIKAVKAGNTGLDVREAFQSVCLNLSNQAVNIIVIACTELSVIAGEVPNDSMSNKEFPYQLIDAAEFLAKETVAFGKSGKAPYRH